MPIDIKPHAYDPQLAPELFEGVLARRVVAFVIDFVIIAVPVLLAAIFIFAFGIVTLGLGFALYWLLPAATVVWALCYCGATLGGPASATIGMRVMDLEMRTWYGAPAYFVLGAVHAIGFWFTASSSPRSCCWSPSSTRGTACCTTCCSARWSSTMRGAPPCCAEAPSVRGPIMAFDVLTGARDAFSRIGANDTLA